MCKKLNNGHSDTMVNLVVQFLVQLSSSSVRATRKCLLITLHWCVSACTIIVQVPDMLARV